MSNQVVYISKLLNEPASITDAEQSEVASIQEAYPYFMPARYIHAAIRHKQEPFSNTMLSPMQLHMGNWLLFHEFISKAAGQEITTPQAAAEPAPSATEILESVAIFAAEEPAPEVVELVQINEAVKEEEPVAATPAPEEQQTEIRAEDMNETNEPLIQPIYTEDYFLHQGVAVSNDIPDVEELKHEQTEEEDEAAKSLMVMMSFSEWLTHFKTKSQKEKEEENEQKALKTMWQKEKLAAALEEENEEIPEDVFEMAVNSITQEEDLASESLAEIHVKQGKYDKAIDMYRKLSLRNPQKSTYFASRIEAILKEKQQ